MKIQELILFTNNIQNQRHFYKLVLGFEAIYDTDEKVSFRTGNSILTFQYNKEAVSPSHFAFNIPSNAVYDALKWLSKKTEVLDCDGNKVADFSNWKAKAIYIYDADKNIVEFIAREQIDIESDVAFSPFLIVSISEVGIATNNIESIYDKINSIKPITIYDGNFERFCAVGNEEGLFILVDKNKKQWYPTMEDIYESDFIIKGDYNFKYINSKIEEITLI